MRACLICLGLMGCVVQGALLPPRAIDEPDPDTRCEADLVGGDEVWSLDVAGDYGVWRAPIELDGDQLTWDAGIYQSHTRQLDLATGEVLSDSTHSDSYVLGRARAVAVDVVARQNQLLAVDRVRGDLRYVLDVPNPTWMAPSSAFAADTLAVVICDQTEATLWVHDVASARTVLRQPLASACAWRTGPVAISGDGSTVAVAIAGSPQIEVFDVASGGRQVLAGHPQAVDEWLGPVAELALSPDGGTLLSVGADDELRRWDLGTGEVVDARPAQRVLVNQNIYAEPDGRAPIAWSPDGHFFGWLDLDDTLRLARSCDGAEAAVSGLAATLAPTDWQSGLPYALRLDPYAGWAVSVHENGVRVWSIEPL